jgi:hypothetical protein
LNQLTPGDHDNRHSAPAIKEILTGRSAFTQGIERAGAQQKMQSCGACSPPAGPVKRCCKRGGRDPKKPLFGERVVMADGCDYNLPLG